MSAITFTSLNYTGTPDADDQRAARYIIDQENARRAALDPPGTPLEKTPGSALKANYLHLLMDDVLTNAHLSYIGQANDAANDGFTDAQVDQIKANLKDRLDAGEDPAAIVADTAS